MEISKSFVSLSNGKGGSETDKSEELLEFFEISNCNEDKNLTMYRLS